MTSITTSLGFLSFVTADLGSFRQYGVIAAVGVMSALITSLSLLPILLLVTPSGWIEVGTTSRYWQRAIERAVRHVGQAVVSTSLALTVGFAALSLSPWASVSHFGLISAIAILAALVADLIVLPALILVTRGR